ncbi:MAG TPA: hypothetical protein VFG84_10490 [Gemmatimonadaceae bacterium]|nr:hypothetical protein [Gemmatimonadaceae bacterium]
MRILIRLVVCAATIMCTARPVIGQYVLPDALHRADQESVAQSDRALVQLFPLMIPTTADSLPYRSRRKYVMTGTLVGLSAGLTIGLISRSRAKCDCFPGKNSIAVSGALLGAGVGALGGLLIHAMITKVDEQRAAAARVPSRPDRPGVR